MFAEIRHHGSADRSGGDWCSRQGAEALRDAITHYWAQRGYAISAHVVDSGFDMATRAGRYDVRSDMRNGLPIRRRAQ